MKFSFAGRKGSALAVLALLALAGCNSHSRDVAWPPSFEPGEAALFSHNEVVIDTPCERVWARLIAASDWPSWYSNARDVRLSPPGARALERDSAFSWTTFDIAVESKVREYVPNSRLAWHGRAEGMSAYHAWLLNPLPGACHVVTEETNNGPAALALRRKNPEAIHDGHATWLAQLKSTCEK